MLKLFNRKKKDNKGFTLVELVAVIAILAILVGLLAPQYTKYVEKARKSSDSSNLENMVRAVEVAIAETDETARVKAGVYEISIGSTGTTLKYGETAASDDKTKDTTNPAVMAIQATIGTSWSDTKLKSADWATTKNTPIKATINVSTDGSFTVKYDPESLELMIGKKTTKTQTTANGGGN